METVEVDRCHLGFAFARWTCELLATYMKEHTRMKVSAWWVGELLRCHGFAWRRAKLTTMYLADEGGKKRAPEGLVSERAVQVMRPGRPSAPPQRKNEETES
jgi:hypothetical protein